MLKSVVEAGLEQLLGVLRLEKEPIQTLWVSWEQFLLLCHSERRVADRKPCFSFLVGRNKLVETRNLNQGSGYIGLVVTFVLMNNLTLGKLYNFWKPLENYILFLWLVFHGCLSS